MPRGIQRLSDEEVRTRIEKYGYFIIDDKPYKNQNTPMKLYDAQLGKNVKLSLRDIKYRIDTGKRAEFDIYNVLNNQPVPPQYRQSAELGYIRFLNKLSRYNKFSTLTEDKKQAAYTVYKQLCSKLGRKQKFEIDFNSDVLNKDLMLFVFVESTQAIKKRMDKRIKLKITDNDGRIHYYELSYDTIDYFQGLLEDKAQQEINTSENDLFESHNDWAKMDVFYTDKVRAGGFFPYLNKLTTLD
jgi:hypothetical protein